MSSSSEEEFQQNDQGSLTYPAQANTLKKGQYVCIKGFPCKIVEVTTSKTGKHGHAKVHATAVDVFTGKKYEENTPGSHNVDCPNVVKNEYDLIDIKDKIITYLEEDGSYNESLTMDVSTELYANLKKDLDGGENCIISVTSAMGRSEVTSYRKE